MSSRLVLVGSVRITVPVSSASIRTHEYAAAPLRGSTDESEQPTTLIINRNQCKIRNATPTHNYCHDQG